MNMYQRAAQIANQLTSQNIQAPNNFLQGGLTAIQNNDTAKGEEIANQILQQAGISREQALAMAHQRGLI